VWTTFGDSTCSTNCKIWDNPVTGIGQGNGTGPQIWAAISSPPFEIMCHDGFLTLLHTVISLHKKEIVSFAFIDDTNLSVSALTQHSLTIATQIKHAIWQESHGNGQWLHVFSWFCSHPVGPYLQDQEWTLNPYQDRLFSHLTFHHDIIHQVQHYISPMTTHTFNNAEPHHPSRTTSSFRASQEVSSGISAEIHRKLIKILGSRLASSPD